jgi:integrase
VAGGKERSRDRVLTDEEIRQLFADPSLDAHVCQFTLLTGARISPVVSATWKQIAGDRWTFRLKASRGDLERREHWVHLAPLAMAILGKPGAPDGPLFPRAVTGRPIDRNALGGWTRAHNAMHGRDLTYLAWSQLGPDERQDNRHRIAWTPHDLRRTACTRISGFGVGWEIVAMKHIGDRLEGVMATYNRAPMEAERVEAAQRWAAIVEEVRA